MMYWGDKGCIQGYTRSLRWNKALTMPLHMSEQCTVYWAIRKDANFLLKILFWPQTLVIWLLGNHNFGSWDFFWYFCQSRKCGFLPNYTFSVLHTYLLGLFLSSMLWAVWCLSQKYLHVLFAVFCLPSVFLWTSWSVSALSVHRKGEHAGDAGLSASLLGGFWLTASCTCLDICGKYCSEISPKLHPHGYQNCFVKWCNLRPI